MLYDIHDYGIYVMAGSKVWHTQHESVPTDVIQALFVLPTQLIRPYFTGWVGLAVE